MTSDELYRQTAGLQAEALVQTVLRHEAIPACLTCSFQAEDMVVLDMARRVRPDLAVLFLDTGYHFAETYAYRDRMTALWGLNLVNLRPELTVEAQESKYGKLFETDPTRCCHIRKVEPLQRALIGHDVWLTGLRREQSPTRAALARDRLPDARFRQANPQGQSPRTMDSEGSLELSGGSRNRSVAVV